MADSLKLVAGNLRNKRVTRKLHQRNGRNVSFSTINNNGEAYFNSTKNIFEQHHQELQQQPLTAEALSTSQQQQQQEKVDEEGQQTQQKQSQSEREEEEEEQQEQPQSQQEEQSDEIDLQDIVTYQSDNRSLVFAWAYILETQRKDQLEEFQRLNHNNIKRLTTASPTSLAENLDHNAAKLLLRYSDLNKEDLLLMRLLLSRIVNTISPSLARRTRMLIGRDVYTTLVTRCAPRLSHDPFDEAIEKSMNTIIDSYVENGSIAAQIAICDIKSGLLKQEPGSSHLITVKALEFVVTHLEAWTKTGKTSEADYYGRFCCLFDLIFMDTDIKMTSGDTTSITTKAFRTSNEKQFGFNSKNGICGRKIDGIIMHKDLELCLCECKPLSASPFILTKQLVKNLRSNGCIHHHLQSLSDQDEQVEEITGVMYVICDIDDVLVASKVGDLVIPTESYDLESFKKTIALLFHLKKQLKCLLKKYRPRQLQRKRDILYTVDESSPPSSPASMYQSTVNPAIYFSPSKHVCH
ncbi:hypothetical protein BCR42DRAFT_427964 [Absidia repens]|uniref:Uncharacterized protein n=1 Tax=Absidia repens TaxID=90262 RepID=A0A1X2HYW5_9FUNG|nr:hypothetical protein BCR42DRAFT_427964 [Absidia repens]